MSQATASVVVDRLENANAAKMTWQHSVTAKDVRSAFNQLDEMLAESDDDFFVVVNLLSNPNFPLNATVDGALFGPYRNPKLRAWLIVGSNPVARLIERLLAGVTNRRNVLWFDTENEALEYLTERPLL